MAVTSEMIEKYDWNEPIAKDRYLAHIVLEACIERNFPEKSMFDGAYMTGIPPKMEILRHRTNNEIPRAMMANDGSNIGIGLEDSCIVWASPSDTLTSLVDKWNKLQTKDKDSEYDWSRQIGEDIDIARKVLTNYIEKCKRGEGDPKRIIRPCRVCGAMPGVCNDKTGCIPYFGCRKAGHKHCYIGSLYSLDDIVEEWNEAQGADDKRDDDNDDDTVALEADLDKGVANYDDAEKLRKAHIPGTKEHEDTVLEETRQKIAEVCDSIKELLLEKNRKYGNSALNPCRIFAKSDSVEQIKVRIDDKLNRIKNEQGDEDEDVVKDLIGYLVLYQVAKMEG